MTRVRVLAILASLAIVLAQVGATAASGVRSPALTRAEAAAAKVDKVVADGKAATFVVEFAAKADLAPAKKMKDHDKQGDYVYGALRTTAAKSQAEAHGVVKKSKGATGTTYWLTNVMVVKGGSPGLAKQLAALDGVTRVRAEKVYPLVKPVEASVAVLAAAGDPEWGVAKIRAPEAWDMGVLGQGVVVANVDTGVDYLHPAIVDQYRGNLGDGTFDHDYDWFDPTGICGDEPCDNAGHGTHTMGTMVGGDGPGDFSPDIGVAPGARWIAAKGCEDFSCSESALLGSGQFILAPTRLDGSDPDPSLRPDIVNNSWGAGPGDPFYLETVQAWRAAGIIPVFSSGNPGPFCGEGGSPGDFLEAFSVGATDSDDLIADFSGRGPSVYGKVNPDVSAPGVDVISSVPGDGYESFSGTSMAAPHTAGTLALVLSAELSLVGDFAAATDAVRTTAVDRIDEECGGDDDGDPNNVYGDGRIDAFAAVELVATGGTVAGTVRDAATNDPIAGATFTLHGDRDLSATTDETGHYELFAAAGTYIASAEAFGYYQAIASVEIVTDQTVTRDFDLDAKPRFAVTGVVRAAESGAALAGADVRALGTPVAAATTGASGAYSLTLPIGTYTLRASAGGCTEPATTEVTIVDAPETADFAVARKLDAFGHGCRPIPFAWTDADTQSALYGDGFDGRLTLPFEVTFYGQTYSQVFISDDGYLSFLPPGTAETPPLGLPSADPPNAAIYALWQNLELDAQSSIDYATVGTAPNRMFVIEYAGVKPRGSSIRLELEIRLHEKAETIDVLYGANPSNPGNGRNAVVGIENADGTDALEFASFDSLIEPASAFRYEMVPVGTIRGTVTDRNDGEPIAGAVVKASPGLVSATTGPDGTYAMRVYPGTYEVTIGAAGYVPAAAPAVVTDGSDETIDASLAAPVPAAAPDALEATVDFGATANATLQLSNVGSAPMTFEVKERSGPSTPTLPPAAVSGTKLPRGVTSSRPAAGYRAQRVTPKVSGGPALVFMDFLPWESDALLQVMDANEISYDVVGSDQMASIDMSAYQVVFISNDQTQEFYDLYAASADRFDAYVAAGGVLFVGAASNGWNGGDWSGGVLPGGVVIGPFAPEELNDVVAPDHPTMAGVPNPFSGSDASHTFFENLPADALVVARGHGGHEPTLVEYGHGGGTVLAVAQTLEFAYEFGQDGAIVLSNAVPYTYEVTTDVPWLSEDPTAGSVATSASRDVTVTMGAANLVPGVYEARILVRTNAPKPRSLLVPVTLTVRLPDSFGAISGTVTDGHSGEPLGGVAVSIAAEWPAGNDRAFTATTASDGTYTIVAPAGTWPATFSLADHVTVSRSVTVEAGKTGQGVDAQLHRRQPHASFEGEAQSFILPEGTSISGTFVLGNPEGHEALTFETHEVDLGGPGTGIAAAAAAQRPTAGAGPKARTTKGLFPGRPAVKVPPRLHAEGDVIASWKPEGLDVPWGVGYDGSVWISDVFEEGDICAAAGTETCIDASFTTAGGPLTSFSTPWVEAFGGDMAYDRGNKLLWQLNVGGDNAIYGLDPVDGSVKQTITGSPWSDSDQRGLAYDPDNDVFYVGGWNEGIVYRVAGPGHDTPGETLGQCNPPDASISGLAWNRSFGLLWEATNSETDTIYLLDPLTCEAMRALDHPGGGDFNGAGIELDAAGNIWTVRQGWADGDTMAYLVDAGLPEYSDASWLTLSPATGSVVPDGSAEIRFKVDTSGLPSGVHRALGVVSTDDPEHPFFMVPISVLVPAYRQGVNSGGGVYVENATSGPIAYAADRAFGAGSFGYEGASSTRSSGSAIAGTNDDPLYQDQRTGMSGYRFTVPDGHYQVVLDFAELQASKAGARVFSVSIEGVVVAANLDVLAAAGGKDTALRAVYEADVADGVLDVTFAAQRGDKPIVNAILVTAWPEGFAP